jgi:large subunit ribosomal protein L11
VIQMPKPWTSKMIIKALGVAKCNGSLEAATEDLSLEKAMGVAKEKADLGHLTGADLKAQTREIIGTCVSMRVKVEGLWAVDALRVIENGDWNDRFI